MTSADHGMGYDLVALHTRWNQNAFKDLLGPEAVYFTILRDPSDTFESLFSYIHMNAHLEMGLNSFIDKLESTPRLRKKRILNYLGLNLQMYEISGLNDGDLSKDEEVDWAIQQIDNNFDLVMIAESMAESTVLLAHLLCLPLKVLNTKLTCW